jgi:fimbrial chaperone protein
LLLASLAWAWAAPTQASSIGVNPVQLRLQPGAASTLLVLRNDGDKPARYELSVFAWRETPEGEMELSPTQDVLFFPQLFALQAKETRSVRVGAAVAFGPVEKSYRLIVQELPPTEKPEASPGVRMLNRVILPIFLAPNAPHVSERVDGLAVSSHKFKFHLRNTGNVHLKPRAVVAQAVDASGEKLFGHTWDGWYVLAGGERVYGLDIPERVCKLVRTLTVEVQAGAGVIREALETPGGACLR